MNIVSIDARTTALLGLHKEQLARVIARLEAYIGATHDLVLADEGEPSPAEAPDVIEPAPEEVVEQKPAAQKKTPTARKGGAKR